MKVLDKIIFAVFVIALIILCFFQNCSRDIYFLIAGFVVAAATLVAMIVQGKKKNKQEEQQ